MLLGKTIVVTGIASGIGARVGELARVLGADVIGVDANLPARPLDASSGLPATNSSSQLMEWIG